MLNKYKQIDPRKTSRYELATNYKQNLHSGSSGVFNIHFRQDGSGLSGSHYNHLRVTYYLSQSYGSKVENGYNGPSYTRGYFDAENPQFRHKFKSSGSILSIPSEYYGEHIKPGSFKLIDNTSAKTITIQDDKYGNLFVVNPPLSRSNSSPSSSDNYVGNIYYEDGMVVLTETASYSQSINYPNILENYTFSFDSQNTIYTSEYSLQIEPGEFNRSMNPTLRKLKTGVDSNNIMALSWSASPDAKDFATGSHFSPVFTYIGLFDQTNTPVLIARYSQPIRIPKSSTLTLKVRYDN
jgi:hypothetical protein